MFAKGLIQILVDALFPSKCLICGSFIEDSGEGASEVAFPPGTEGHGSQFRYDFKQMLSKMVCSSCCQSFDPITSPICPDCGLMFQSKAGLDHQCETCIKQPNYFRKARAFGVFDGPLMDLIHCFKYREKIQLAYPFGRLLQSALQVFWDDPEVHHDAVIPVPLHEKRFRERGFNQAYLMVRNWAERLIDNRSPLPVIKDVLYRKAWRLPQTGLGRKERIKNIRGTMAIHHPDKIQHKNILLVDDVFTTGATVNECAKVLLAAGAERVDVLTLARAI